MEHATRTKSNWLTPRIFQSSMGHHTSFPRDMIDLNELDLKPGLGDIRVTGSTG